MLQLMPGADEDIIPKLEANIASLEPVTTMMRNGQGAADIIDRILNGIEYDLFDEIEVDYECPCSRDSYIRGLMSLGCDELSKLAAEGKTIETKCRYCGAKNEFTVDELNDMIKAINDNK